MGIKWRRRKNQFSGRLTGSFLVFALVLGLTALAPGMDGAAEAVDLNSSCSLRVAPADPSSYNGDMIADLEGARITVDLYKVAEAEPVSGYDTYTYRFLDGYQELLEKVYQQDADHAQWQRMAQMAAGYVRDHQKDTDQPDGAKPAASVLVNGGYAEFGGLGSGLYLLVARGDNAKDYWTTVKSKDAGESGEQSEKIATLARSAQYTYTYAPELVSLPGKEGNNTSGNNGSWLYHMTVSLKPEQSVRYGSLEIVKTLLSYEVKDPATFIFEVTAEQEGETVFQDNVSLTFGPGDESGEKRVVLEKRIPVGASVTVREVYSGAAYELVSASSQTAVIEADRMASVSFTNDYNETNRGGGSVTNSFSHTDAGWSLKKIFDDGRVEEQGNK